VLGYGFPKLGGVGARQRGPVQITVEGIHARDLASLSSFTANICKLGVKRHLKPFIFTGKYNDNYKKNRRGNAKKRDLVTLAILGHEPILV